MKTNDTHKVAQNTLEDMRVSLKLKLASLWASVMFLIIYLDYFHLYMPSKINEIQTGKVFQFEITQGFLIVAFTSVTIPALMIFLSVALKAKVNRWTNIIIATLYIPFVLFNLAGDVWIHMVIGAIIEVVLFCLVIHFAWNWPRVKK